jgi:hypothetical protein
MNDKQKIDHQQKDEEKAKKMMKKKHGQCRQSCSKRTGWRTPSSRCIRPRVAALFLSPTAPPLRFQRLG